MVGVRLNLVRSPIAPPTFAWPWKVFRAASEVSKEVVVSDARAIQPRSNNDR